MTQTIRDRILSYFKRHYEFDANHWIPKFVMEELFEQANFLVETGNRTLRRLVELGELEERPMGKTIEYRLKTSQKPILSLTGGLPTEVAAYFDGE